MNPPRLSRLLRPLDFLAIENRTFGVLECRANIALKAKLGVQIIEQQLRRCPFVGLATEVDSGFHGQIFWLGNLALVFLHLVILDQGQAHESLKRSQPPLGRQRQPIKGRVQNRH
jgi:hypothetical protein